MLFVLSPAKRLDYETPVPEALWAAATPPRYTREAAELIDVLKPLAPDDIAALMGLSDDLSTLNARRYAAWSPRATRRNSRPAILAFAGDVYGGLDAGSLDEDDLGWAQQHLAILSGLYGVLRPFDKLQPYRLEMGTRLANPRGADLYAYWQSTVAAHLNRLARADASPVIVNLASQEYFRAVDRTRLKPRVIDCVFEDWNGGAWKVVGFHAKRARGLMARHAVRHRIATPQGLETFDGEGYAYAPAVSTPERPVFRRKIAG